MTGEKEIMPQQPMEAPKASARKIGLEWKQRFLPLVIALSGSMVIGAVIIAVSGENPFRAYGSLFFGAFGDTYNLAATFGRSIPIIGCGIAAALAFRAGLFNIGGEGQFVLGALAATVAVLKLPPGGLALFLALIFSLLAGGIWGFLAGFFQVRFKVPILISSLLMNYIAVNFASYMVSFPLIEKGGSRNQTAIFPEASRFARLFSGTSLHWGIFIVIAIILITSVVLYKSVSGYNLRMFGANRMFAVSSGINSVRMTLAVMLCSGMIAGITGANQVLGIHYRFIDTSLTLPGYAWTGVMAAILANNDPLGVVAAGVFFAALQTGALGMERATEVPAQLSDIVQAVMIILVAVRAILSYKPEVRDV